MKTLFPIVILSLSILLSNNVAARYAIGAINPEGDPPPSNSVGEQPTSNTADETPPPSSSIDAGFEALAELQQMVDNHISTTSNDDNDNDNDNNSNSDSSVFDAGYDALNELKEINGISNNNSNSSSTLVDSNGCLVDFGCDIGGANYNDHERAMTRARIVADRECSRNCNPAVRVMIINKEYYDDLHRQGSSLPTGPMESMVYFTETYDVGNNNNAAPSSIADMDDIDRRVRNGEFGVIMPGQFPMASPQLYEEMNATQRLGVENAPIITSAGRYIDESFPQETGGAGALTASFGGTGGTIVLRDTFSEGQLNHEANHAGENALREIVENTNLTKYDTSEQRDTAFMAHSIVSTLDAPIPESECPSCSVFTDATEDLKRFSEARAYISEGDNLEDFKSNLQDELGISSSLANKIALELLLSPVITEQREIIEEASQILLDSNL